MVLVVAACFVFLGQKIWAYWPEIEIIFKNINYCALGKSSLVLFFAFLIRPAAFHIFLFFSSVNRVSYFQNLRAYYLTQLTKYLPGGIWVYPSRVIVLNQTGVETSVSSLGLVFESITMVIAGFLIGALFFINGLTTISWLKQNQIIILIGGLILSLGFMMLPELFYRFFPFWYEKIEVLKAIRKLTILNRLKIFLLGVAVCGVMMVLSGISFHLLIVSLIKNLDNQLFFSAIGIFSLAWLVGFLSIFNPGGVGLREAVIVLLLGNNLSEPVPLMAAILLRIVWSVGEVAFFFVFWCLDFFKKVSIRKGQ